MESFRNNTTIKRNTYQIIKNIFNTLISYHKKKSTKVLVNYARKYILEKFLEIEKIKCIVKLENNEHS